MTLRWQHGLLCLTSFVIVAATRRKAPVWISDRSGMSDYLRELLLAYAFQLSRRGVPRVSAALLAGRARPRQTGGWSGLIVSISHTHMPILSSGSSGSASGSAARAP